MNLFGNFIGRYGANYMDGCVSLATKRNWSKLNTITEDRLVMRANKRMSKKRFIPTEYIISDSSVSVIHNIIEMVDKYSWDINSVLLSVGKNLLKQKGISEESHVSCVLAEYSNVSEIDMLLDLDLPDDEFDFLGALYQSYLQEGEKNILGSYYTPVSVSGNMVKNCKMDGGQLFLDPCCGSGSFLLGVHTDNPDQLFGIDNDRIAVMIAKINMLLKFSSCKFIPNIFCINFLSVSSMMSVPMFRNKRFDYIITNPPWGAMNSCSDLPSNIVTKETFSQFFEKSYDLLKLGGTIRFLFPKAILNVKTHRYIRKFIVEKAGLISITCYCNSFSQVTTEYVDIECGLNQRDFFTYYHGCVCRKVLIKSVYETDNLVFNILSDEDTDIVRIVKNKGLFFLNNSVWALGIVTGDNKRKLFRDEQNGLEKIYTGKEIMQYRLKPAINYLKYDRSNLQQVAKEEIYRCEEKLVYKFISNKLVFAYDNTGGLFLNSANILIPNIPGMCIKTVMAFLNSKLFQFMYTKLFGETKILKGNLQELPFPQIGESEDKKISVFVDDILAGDDRKIDVIDDYIFELYGFSQQQMEYIRRFADGKVN